MSNYPPQIPGGAQFTCAMGIYTFFDGMLTFYVEDTPLTMDKMRESFEAIKQTIGHKPVKAIVEVSEVKLLSREMMEYAAAELPLVFSALAVVSRSQMATLVANVFLHLMHPAVPIKLFENETEAQKWLKEVHS